MKNIRYLKFKQSLFLKNVPAETFVMEPVLGGNFEMGLVNVSIRFHLVYEHCTICPSPVFH